MSLSSSSQTGIGLSDGQRLDWLRLIRSENVGPATFLDLISRFGTAAAALEAVPELAQRSGKRALKLASVADAERELEQVRQIGAQLVCLGEPNYPSALRSADSPPPVITVAGNAACLVRASVAFVGSRNASLAGVKMTTMLAAEVAQQDYLITSGLARGIDSAAHRAGIERGTVAVFAGGIDKIYPNENKQLAHDIANKGGVLLTEMPYGWQPRAQDFPRRNRIVAGMSLGLVVVEAARRSGSLISARLANEMGRQVFAVPGSPLDPRSEGANMLIKQGAQLITQASDIIEMLNPMNELIPQSHYNLSENDVLGFEKEPSDDDKTRLISAIGHTPTDIDEAIRFTGVEAAQAQLIILELDLAGKLERHTGNRVSMI